MSRLKHTLRQAFRRLGYELIPVQAALPKCIRQDYDIVLDRIGRYSFKFLDVKTFLPITLRRAYALNLHRSDPLNVLDIGTGTGYFPVVCSHYGHRAIAIDQPGNVVFEDVVRWLGVDRRFHEIRAFEPLPAFGERFDLITAFMVNFDRHPERDYAPWGVAEWKFFLEDLAYSHLAGTGQIALQFNEHTRAQSEVMDFFARMKAMYADEINVIDAGAIMRMRSSSK